MCRLFYNFGVTVGDRVLLNGEDEGDDLPGEEAEVRYFCVVGRELDDV